MIVVNGKELSLTQIYLYKRCVNCLYFIASVKVPFVFIVRNKNDNTTYICCIFGKKIAKRVAHF